MIPLNLKIDKDDILYLDTAIDKNMKITFTNKGYKTDYTFYKIPGSKEYILKYNEDMLDNSSNIKKMLYNFNKKRDRIIDIDFPIGYYLENGYLTGLIVYYYSHSLSLNEFLKNYRVTDLPNYYYHNDNLYKNICMLLLDIIEIIEKMLDEKIGYIDIHGDNFVLYNNLIKIIDFEPEKMIFNFDNSDYQQILFYLEHLIYYISYKLGLSFNMTNINSISNIKTEVKKLEKRMK